MKKRCHWVTEDALYIQYHDHEWGVPVKDEHTFFEFLVLECFQAGLNWLTILKKRERFRQAFDAFDYEKIAHYSEEKVSELMQNKGIIRHEGKIRAAINNAQKFIEIQSEFGSFSKFIWGFTEGEVVKNHWERGDEIPANTPLSDEISKALKKRGFKFVGSTTVYAFLQATGIVNDHISSCFCYSPE